MVSGWVPVCLVTSLGSVGYSASVPATTPHEDWGGQVDGFVDREPARGQNLSCRAYTQVGLMLALSFLCVCVGNV